jgi:ABC-type Fe3+/spermidine/putrescine transport system ATPase subunit
MLTISAINKSYASLPVLHGISLNVHAGETVALLGPSGCGKTTLLRIVAGLERADSGTIRFAGEPIDVVPAHQRGFGLMFQEYALFPHLSVAENIAYGLRMRNQSASAVQTRVADMLDLVGLSAYGERRVFQLSGGERQRVALARTLAPQPRLLMFDEPLAALDRALRERLQGELAAIVRQVGVTTLYVTHDQQEAFALADRVALMNAGTLAQFDTPEAIYRQPASAWVARFQGLENVLRGELLGDGYVQMAIGVLRYEEQRTWEPERREPRTENREPRAENREPRAENREPRTENRGTENREPRTENRELRTENREPRTENREPRTENLRTENREPRTENRELRTEKRELGIESRGRSVDIVIYPDAALLADGMGENIVTAVITAKRFRGRFYQVELKIDAIDLTFEFDSDPGPPGTTLQLRLDAQRIRLLTAN